MATSTKLDQHKIVSQDEWLQARRALMEKEKKLMKEQDALAAELRELPWVKIDKPYTFDTPRGKQTLSELFEGRSQLVVYHFMFGPDWNEGCPGCSFIMDHMDGAIAHLKARDVTMVAVSRAPRDKLLAYQKRMGWSFPWMSAVGDEFNRDFGVTFTKEQVANQEQLYNFDTTPPNEAEKHGLSVFYKNAQGEVFRTYSVYARGCETMLGTYAVLDWVPKGRDEGGQGMKWLRRRDQYEPTVVNIGY